MLKESIWMLRKAAYLASFKSRLDPSHHINFTTFPKAKTLHKNALEALHWHSAPVSFTFFLSKIDTLDFDRFEAETPESPQCWSVCIKIWHWKIKKVQYFLFSAFIQSQVCFSLLESYLKGLWMEQCNDVGVEHELNLPHWISLCLIELKLMSFQTASSG